MLFSGSDKETAEGPLNYLPEIGFYFVLSVAECQEAKLTPGTSAIKRLTSNNAQRSKLKLHFTVQFGQPAFGSLIPSPDDEGTCREFRSNLYSTLATMQMSSICSLLLWYRGIVRRNNAF